MVRFMVVEVFGTFVFDTCVGVYCLGFAYLAYFADLVSLLTLYLG